MLVGAWAYMLNELLDLARETEPLELDRAKLVDTHHGFCRVLPVGLERSSARLFRPH